MQALLSGLRIVEGSAFIAAPMCGMTLAQMGADVIRFDQIGGGLDYHRWPVTRDDVSIYWAEMNKGSVRWRSTCATRPAANWWPISSARRASTPAFSRPTCPPAAFSPTTRCVRAGRI